MDLPKNHFKAALKQGRQQIGMWCTLAGGAYAEMLAACGYDWIVLDTEHAPLGLQDVHAMLQAMAPYPVSPIVRPGWNDPVEIKRLLDIGVQSLLIPYIQNVEEAKRAIAAVRYPPEGMRGVAGMTRASRYGLVPDYYRKAADEICLLLQIETQTALSEIEAIAALDGVDGIFVGPADLGASMGHLGNFGEPTVRRTVIDAIRRISAAGKPAGIVMLDPDMLAEAIDAGTLFTAIGIDSVVITSALRDLRGRYA